jgi:5-methylcytosine-specific restriction enzyme A
MECPVIPMRAPLHKPVRWNTGQLIREHNARSVFYHSKAWRSARAEVLKRDGYTCQLQLVGCKRRATTADHIVERREGGSDDDANLRSVCASCHNKRHPSKGYG